ncbi:MAG TPA: ABC transporter ATP-binding protein, partial [Candidatus Methylomirabilis sp.]|nr:ABC transporter ATP-binding protein [Candidatus Methylomirabilis sp.]
LLRTAAGLVRPLRGEVRFQGESLRGTRPHRIVERGIVLVPEGRRLFARMTVLENLELGAYTPAARARREETLAWVYQIFPVLRERRYQRAGSLSGGEQQMLAVGRGLMARPRLLLLDEPSWGLAPKVVDQIFRVIGEINRRGVTILMVEQNVPAALGLAGRAYILETGRIVAEGPAAELLQRDHVRQSYLGLLPGTT